MLLAPNPGHSKPSELCREAAAPAPSQSASKYVSARSMDMRIKVGVGFGLWSMGVPKPETIVSVAEKAEHWGVDSFWLADQIMPRTPDLDVVAVLSLLASRTSRIKLGPSVLLLNLRHPLLVAKAFATLDYLSNGRIVMAVGTGANLAEYAAMGVPTEARGARLDEAIQVLRTVWR